MNKKIQTRFEKLEKKLNNQDSVLTQKITNESKSFNPLKLLKERCEIDSYTKLGITYYFLKKADFFRILNYYMASVEIGNGDVGQVSPDFTNIQELYMWIIENYKELNSPKKEVKPKKGKKK